MNINKSIILEKYKVSDIEQNNLSKTSFIKKQLLDKNIRFLDKLLEKYTFPEAESININKYYRKFKDRYNDINLYLGVVGEFSSGKSTFINAMIEDDLLTTDILQATTSSATIIEYGKKLDSIVKFETGQQKIFTELLNKNKQQGMTGLKSLFKKLRSKNIEIRNKIENIEFNKKLIKTFKNKNENEIFKDFIDNVTANEEIAKSIRTVIIQHPSECLKDNLVIIDTPGINADNNRHLDVTKKILEEKCDAGIIIIPANIPLSRSLQIFLESNLKYILHRCIFLITKIDNIRLKEREQLINTIKKRIQTELNVVEPFILASSPVYVEENIKKRNKPDYNDFSCSEEEMKKYLEKFKKSKESLLTFLQQQRDYILFENINQILMMLMKDLTNSMIKLKEYFNSLHRTLMKNKVQKLEPFIEKQKEIYSNILSKIINQKSTDMEVAIDNCYSKLLTKVKENINCFLDKYALKKYFKSESKTNKYYDPNTQEYFYMNNLQKDIEGFINGLNQNIKSFEKDLLAKTRSEVNNFEKEFRKLYESLATLDGKINNTYSLITELKSVKTSLNKTGSSSLETVNESISNSHVAMGWGIGGGGVIGQILIPIPVIGFIIGSIFGGWLSTTFGPSLDELKNKSLNEVNKQINKSWQNIKNKAVQEFNKFGDNLLNDFNSLMDNYFKAYSKLVDDMIAEDQRREKELKDNQKIIDDDKENIQVRLQILQSISESIKGY